MSNEIYDAGTKFVAGYDKPVELTEDDKKDFPQELKDLEILDGPLLQHEDSKLRKFTFDKFYRHNDEQVFILTKRFLEKNLNFLRNFSLIFLYPFEKFFAEKFRYIVQKPIRTNDMSFEIERHQN